MGIFDSFRKRQPDVPSSAPSVEDGAALQLLLRAPLASDFEALQRQIRAHDPALKAATASGIGTATAPGEDGSLLAEVAWGAHRVKVVAFPLPMPAEVVEVCVAPAHYDDDRKTEICAHTAHALLYYNGSATNTHEQFVAVALIAGAIAGENGLAILNETARTSLPAIVITSDMGLKPSELWRTLPALYLFAGFVKYEVENRDGVWMRTHGLETFGLPNLATHAHGHERGGEIFEIFGNVADYLMVQGPVLAAGHTMQVSENQWMRLRELSADEQMLADDAPLLVAEFIGADEINPHLYGSENAH